MRSDDEEAPQMACECVSCGDTEVMVALHTAREPAADDWRAFEDELRKVIAKLQGDKDRLCLLIVSDGFYPSSKQRRVLHDEIYEGHAIRCTVTTDVLHQVPEQQSAAADISFLNPGSVFLQPERFTEALEVRNLQDFRDQLWGTLRRLQQGMAPVRTLERVASHHGWPLQFDD